MNQVTNKQLWPLSQKNSFFLPSLALSIALLILSLAAILTRLAEFDLGASATVFNRCWIATVTFALWEGSRVIFSVNPEQEAELSRDITVKDIALFVAESLMSFGCLFLWAISLTKTSVANAHLLHNMTPIFSTLGGWLFLKQEFDKRFLIGLGVALLASSYIELEDWVISPSSFTGDMLALLSSVFYGGSFLCREFLRSKYSASIILLASCSLRTIFALFLALATEDLLLPSTQLTWFSVLALGIVVQFFGHSLLTYSLKYFSSGFATLCLLLDPIITALLAWKIFDEELTLLNIIALIGVIAGIYLASIGRGSQKAIGSQTEDNKPT
ncbi:MAG: DMT family transporter [Oscillatoria sp. SIO1A7]|nr:DMT family transporter [Oscillatoria sp. SIO1A7]